MRTEGAKAEKQTDNFGTATDKAGTASKKTSEHVGALAAIQQQASKHAGEHAFALGRMERNLAGVAERALGLNPTLGLLSSSLLKFGVGTIQTIGILAGIAAIAAAWAKLTEETRKATEAQDAGAKSALAALQAHVQGPGGTLGVDATGAQGRLDDLIRERATGGGDLWYERLKHRIDDNWLANQGLNPQSKKDHERDTEIAILQFALKSAKTDIELSQSRQFAGSVSTPFDRAMTRGTSIDGFYSKALAAEGQLSELAKSGTYEVRDAALQAMSTMEKIINHIKLIRMGLAEAPSQVLGLPSDVALGGLKNTGGAIGGGIDIAGRHGGSIADFSSQIQAYLKTTSIALNEQGSIWTTVKQAIQAAADQAQLYADAVILGAGGGDSYAASIRNRQSSNGALNNAEAQTKYGQALADREAAVKLPAVFDAVREAALRLKEGLRTAGQSFEMGLAGWGITSTIGKNGSRDFHFDKDAIGGGVQNGVLGAAGDALAQFSPQALAYRAVSSGLNFIAKGFTDLALGMLDGGAKAKEYARALKQQRDEYAASIAQFKHDDLAAALAQNMATADQLLRQWQDSLGGIEGVIQLLKGGGVPGAIQSRDEIAKQEAKNAEIIKRQAVYAQEDLAVRNMRATGQGDAADLLAFQEKQAREMQAALDANKDATYLSYLATVQNNELLAFQNGLLSTALRNAPTGFWGIAAYAGQFANPSVGPPGWPGDSGPGTGGPDNPRGGVPPLGGGGGQKRPGLGPLTVNVMLPDGRIIGKVFVKDLAQHAASTNGAGSSLSDALETYPH